MKVGRERDDCQAKAVNGSPWSVREDGEGEWKEDGITPNPEEK